MLRGRRVKGHFILGKSPPARPKRISGTAIQDLIALIGRKKKHPLGSEGGLDKEVGKIDALVCHVQVLPGLKAWVQTTS